MNKSFAINSMNQLTKNGSNKDTIAKYLFEIKDYTGINSDSDAMRFCITFAYRKLVEIK